MIIDGPASKQEVNVRRKAAATKESKESKEIRKRTKAGRRQDVLDIYRGSIIWVYGRDGGMGSPKRQAVSK